MGQRVKLVTIIVAGSRGLKYVEDESRNSFRESTTITVSEHVVFCDDLSFVFVAKRQFCFIQ